MYLKWTSEFIKFIADQDHSIEEVLAHLVLRVMAPLQASSAFISTLDNQDSLVTVGRFGIPAEISGAYDQDFSLSDRLPITDAIRLRKIITINTLPMWPDEYTEILNFPYSSEEAAFIAFPIERSGTPVAVAGIFFSSKIDINPDLEIFFQSIANILTIYLYPQGVTSPHSGQSNTMKLVRSSQRGLELTQRQQLILHMISEGRTNVGIGEMLKYSESTIRQETIKIFSKLGCDGRVQASTIYKDQLTKVGAAS
jgi:DNA-binding CsgD family transcriptional regulator